MTGHRASLRAALTAARQRTERLVAPLSHEDVHDQFFDFLSPLVWDIGHIGNFEELWLLRQVDGRPPADPALDELYNPFEQPRPVRGDLALPPHEQSRRYLQEVRGEVLALLDRTELAPDDPLLADGSVYRMIVQHESQHQETMLQAIGLRTDLPYVPAMPSRSRGRRRVVDDRDRVVVDAGPVVVGTDERGWTYDNERPAHRRDVATFAIDRFPVTARRYATFIANGGYRRPELWSEPGWRWLVDAGVTAPQGWEPGIDGAWQLRRFGYPHPLDPTEPVQHVSWYEADAFARWAGGRLPTEVEWEKAASWDPAAGRKRRFPWGDSPPTAERANLDTRRFGPAPVGTYPAGASAYRVEQLAGDVYEWTASPFHGYQGFAAHPYREYSEVFFGGDYRVLRGCSWAVPAPFARTTYRNWDHPYRRQLMAGIRVAYDHQD